MDEMPYCQRGEQTKEKKCKTGQHRAAAQWIQGSEAEKEGDISEGCMWEKKRK